MIKVSSVQQQVNKSFLPQTKPAPKDRLLAQCRHCRIDLPQSALSGKNSKSNLNRHLKYTCRSGNRFECLKCHKPFPQRQVCLILYFKHQSVRTSLFGCGYLSPQLSKPFLTFQNCQIHLKRIHKVDVSKLKDYIKEHKIDGRGRKN